jgi:hypothetical protein
MSDIHTGLPTGCNTAGRPIRFVLLGSANVADAPASRQGTLPFFARFANFNLLRFIAEENHMRKTLSRLAFALWILAAPIVLVGCSGGEAPAPAPAPAGGTETPAPAPAPAEGGAPAPAPTPPAEPAK